MSTLPTITHYDVLRVPRNATIEQIKKAYRKAARELHPDVTGDDTSRDLLATVAAAYEVLSSESKRKDYDLSLDRGYAFDESNSFDDRAAEEANDYSQNDYNSSPSWGTQSEYRGATPEYGSKEYWNARYADPTPPAPPAGARYTPVNNVETKPAPMSPSVPQGLVWSFANFVRPVAIVVAIITYLLPLAIPLLVQGFDLTFFMIAAVWMVGGAGAQLFLLAPRARGNVGFGRRYVLYCILLGVMFGIWTMVSPYMGVVSALQILATLTAVEGIRVRSLRRHLNK